MNVADYWPMAREYLIWNAIVAALQFWTADLKAHVLSIAIELNKSTMHSFTLHLCIYYASSVKKFYLVTS